MSTPGNRPVRRRVARAAAAGLLAAVTATSPRVSGADGDGAAAAYPQAARVVSVGGAITEIVAELGARDRLVAVDTSSQYPPEVGALPKVGYQRTLSAEGLLSLRPDLVLAGPDAGPPEALERVRAVGVPVVRVAGADTPAGVLDKVARVADALGLPARGQTLTARLRTDFDALAASAAGADAERRVLFLLDVGRGAPMVGGRDTAADAIIRLAGAHNALDAHPGYKPINPEAVIAARPEALLMSERTLELIGGVDAVLALPGIAHTPAGRARRVIAMDGLLLLGFGPRTAQAATRLRDALHPREVARVD